MITCHLRYEIDPDQIDAFERFAKAWMELVNRHGGTHHGYFLPSEGASDIAYALFSFPSLADYERYRQRFGVDPDFVAADRIRDVSGCVRRYERTFLRPLLPKLSPPRGHESLREQQHHEHDDQAVDPRGDRGQVEVQAEARREVEEDVGQQVVVEHRQQDRGEDDAADRPEPAEHDHREDEDREREPELARVDDRQVGGEEGAGDPAERRARAVGQQLRAGDRDADRRGGLLVVAQGDPRAADAGVAQVHVDHQHDGHEHEREPVPGRRSSAPNGSSSGRSIRSIGPIPIAPEVSVPPNTPTAFPFTTTWPMISPNASVTIAM